MAFTHNHPVDVADALKFRDVSVATRKKLEELLLSGYRPAAAINLHKYDLQQEDPEAYVYKSADRAQCPDKQYVYRYVVQLLSSHALCTIWRASGCSCTINLCLYSLFIGRGVSEVQLVCSRERF